MSRSGLFTIFCMRKFTNIKIPYGSVRCFQNDKRYRFFPPTLKKKKKKRFKQEKANEVKSSHSPRRGSP